MISCRNEAIWSNAQIFSSKKKKKSKLKRKDLKLTLVEKMSIGLISHHDHLKDDLCESEQDWDAKDNTLQYNRGF